MEYIYYVHQRLKNIFVDYNYAYYNFRYIDVFNIHVDENSTKSRKSLPLVGHMNYNLHVYMSSLTRVIIDCIDYVSHITITSNILCLRTTYHVIAISCTSCLQVTYDERRHVTKHFTCSYSCSLRHDHSKLRGHMNQFQVMDA